MPHSHYVVNVISSNITFSGSTWIMRNSGGGMRALSSVVTFENYTLFDNNSVPHLYNGGALSCQDGKVIFQGKTLFIRNSAMMMVE